MQILDEGSLVLRSKPRVDAFDTRRLGALTSGMRPVVAPVDQFSVIGWSIPIFLPALSYASWMP
jgi:hypothetical protein